MMAKYGWPEYASAGVTRGPKMIQFWWKLHFFQKWIPTISPLYLLLLFCDQFSMYDNRVFKLQQFCKILMINDPTRYTQSRDQKKCCFSKCHFWGAVAPPLYGRSVKWLYFWNLLHVYIICTKFGCCSISSLGDTEVRSWKKINVVPKLDQNW